MKKRIITLIFVIVLLVPIVAKAEKRIPFEGLLFNDYDIMLDSDVEEYYITVENNIDKLSIANDNKCTEDELCLDVHLLEYFLTYSNSFILNDEQVSPIEKIIYANNYDDVIFDEEVESTKICDFYKIDDKTRMLFCKIYDNEDKDNLLYEERTIYDENEEIIGYTKYKDDEYIDSHYYMGNLNVGENLLYIKKNASTHIIHITRKEKEEVIPKEEVAKEDNNTIKEDDNIKESPNTGSTINIVIGLFLLISFSILLYLDRKRKYENSLK